MTELTASRTLVKSPPELWAECSDAASLSRHLDGFGEIRITRLEPETVVAWEGESASGMVRLEPSGWGTRVVLTAEPAVEDLGPAADVATPDVDVPAQVTEEPGAVADEPASVPDEPASVADEPASVAEPASPVPEDAAPVRPPRGGLFARLLRRFGPRRLAQVEPAAVLTPEPVAVGEPEAVAVAEPEAVTVAVAEPEAVAVAVAEQEDGAVEVEPVATGDPGGDGDALSAVAVELRALEQALDSLGQAHHRPFSRA